MVFGKELENGNVNTTAAYLNGHRYTFDNFEIDPANRLLLREGEVVPLTGKVFDVLLVFAENPGRLLEKDELIEKVWHADFVEEGNLARNVSTLRKALGDTGKEHKYIVTLQGRGYRFIADVKQIVNGGIPTINEPIKNPVQTAVDSEDETVPAKRISRKTFWVMAAIIVVFTIAWIGKESFFTPKNKVKSLAVLPLKSLDANDNYLGIGITDAVIRRLSQSGQLTVRPTSAVLRYVNQDTDTLAAARELSSDAVLEGNVQRSGDRLRVSVNLLRTADGASLWSDNFDMPAADIFAIQDKVAQQVAARLQLHIDSAQGPTQGGKYPANPAAYEFYIKGIFSLDQRSYAQESLSQMQDTIKFFNRSIEADPEYALAHAQLAWAYVWTAQFIEPREAKWADLARQEIKRADELDPQIAETHLAKAMLFWSKYENFQNDAAIRELKIAQQLNPDTSHGELVGILGHLGLDEQAAAELNHALEIDPTSESLKDLKVILPYLRGDADAWLIERQKPRGKNAYFDPWYYLRKGQLDIAKKAFDERFPEGLNYPDFLVLQALYFALKGDFHNAESQVPGLIEKIASGDQIRHHVTYNAACIYALDGKSSEAVKWLRETSDLGYPNYPLFARDPFLDRIRQTPEFVQFLNEQKAQHERFLQEFGG
jgi:DNA-binding winged helix-turn-helix (wHTH) protein/TolB-like protein